ncbi:S-layer homology domain-containing protein [Propionibacterium freudenreichii]
MIGSSFITPAHADTVPGVADTTALTSPVAPADAFKGDATPNSLEPESADPLPGIVSVAPTQVGDTVTPPPQAGGEHQADGQATTDTHIVKPETPPISGESYVVPEVQGISYQVDGKDVTGVQSVARGTSVNITAVAKPGFVLDKDVQSSWKYVNYFPANPVKPSRTENTITIPVSDGVSYQVDDATVTGTLTVPQDKPLTVKATTAEGYAFPKKATTSWDFTYTATAKPAEPTRSGGIITIPATTGVDYLVGGEVVRGTVSVAKGRAVTVTAQPGAGYRLAAGATQTWTMPPTTNDTPPTTGDDTEAGNKGAGGGGTGGSTGSGATTPNEGGAPYDKNTAAKPATQPFADVTASMQFANDIAWLKDRGITTGWPDGTFRPVTPVSRDAMIAYIYRMAGSPKYTPTAPNILRCCAGRRVLHGD